ncbi:hypothetical protein G6F55_004596 [Rhizopus delemar]|nr:hypothetical protein G6F55_004596 [Rhizopus delemar]KAG1515851.1 hypothetical protein G6F52_009583 [Rhizopus delemar]
MRNVALLMFVMFNFYVMEAYARFCCTMFWADRGSILKGTKDVAEIWIQTDGREHSCKYAIVVNADFKTIGDCTFNGSNNLVSADIGLNGQKYTVNWTRSKDTCGAHNWSVKSTDWSNGLFELMDSSRSWANCAPAWAGF